MRFYEMSFPKESRTADYVEHENHADLANLIAYLFIHLMDSDMSD